MARYYDVDKILEKIREFYRVNPSGDKFMDIFCAFNENNCKQIIEEVIKELPTADVVEVPESGIGNLSDGYHTFNELYHHRAILFSVICNSMPDKAWKSKLHDTGDMFDNMFIVGIETPNGQATYHYDIEPYWDMFKVKELEKAPKWDGHTPVDAINRIATLSADVVEVKHGEWIDKENPQWRAYNIRYCSVCGWNIPKNNLRKKDMNWKYCPSCGAKMDGNNVPTK